MKLYRDEGLRFKMKILVTSLPDLKKISPQRPHHLLKSRLHLLV